MSTRWTGTRPVITVLAAVAVAFASWLLVADPSLGRGGRPGDDGGPTRGTPSLARPVPQSHGYGGYSRGACRAATWKPLSHPEEFIRRGTVRCFEGNGNPTGDNPDLSTEAFVADALTGRLANMTRDERRCVEGPSQGAPCSTEDDCPQGSCQDMHVGACASDTRARAVFFLFDGNPTGENADLGDELFAFDPRAGQLTQLTKQGGWCGDDAMTPCTQASDCGTTGQCNRAKMMGLEVSSEGRFVWVLSDGDLANNPGHAITQYALVTRGRGRGVRTVGSAGRYCIANAANRGQPCTKDADCGPLCGDGRKDPTEQCDSFGYGGQNLCAAGQYCARPGTANQCTCRTPVCGNGLVEPGESCDGPGRCRGGFVCSGNCQSCVPGSPSGAFL